jgi:hypothetical protein
MSQDKRLGLCISPIWLDMKMVLCTDEGGPQKTKHTFAQEIRGLAETILTEMRINCCILPSDSQ